MCAITSGKWRSATGRGEVVSGRQRLLCRCGVRRKWSETKGIWECIETKLGATFSSRLTTAAFRNLLKRSGKHMYQLPWRESKKICILPQGVHSNFCLSTIGPQPLVKQVLHRVRSSASAFCIQYPLFSLRSCSSCLCLLHRLRFTALIPSFFL